MHANTFSFSYNEDFIVKKGMNVFVFKISHYLLYLFKRVLQHCFAVQFQTCSVDYDTSPVPLLAWR